MKRMPRWMRDGWKPAGPRKCRCPHCGAVLTTAGLGRVKHAQICPGESLPLDTAIEFLLDTCGRQDVPLLRRVSVALAFHKGLVRDLGGDAPAARRLCTRGHPLIEPLACEHYRVREPFREYLYRQLPSSERRAIALELLAASPQGSDERLYQELTTSETPNKVLYEALAPCLAIWDVAGSRALLSLAREALARRGEDDRGLREAIEVVTARVEQQSEARSARLDACAAGYVPNADTEAEPS